MTGGVGGPVSVETLQRRSVAASIRKSDAAPRRWRYVRADSQRANSPEPGADHDQNLRTEIPAGARGAPSNRCGRQGADPSAGRLVSRRPDAILREVFLRTRDRPFTAIDDVISREELVALSEGYKRIAGYSKESLRN